MKKLCQISIKNWIFLQQHTFRHSGSELDNHKIHERNNTRQTTLWFPLIHSILLTKSKRFAPVTGKKKEKNTSILPGSCLNDARWMFEPKRKKQCTRRVWEKLRVNLLSVELLVYLWEWICEIVSFSFFSLPLQFPASDRTLPHSPTFPVAPNFSPPPQSAVFCSSVLFKEENYERGWNIPSVQGLRLHEPLKLLLIQIIYGSKKRRKDSQVKLNWWWSCLVCCHVVMKVFFYLTELVWQSKALKAIKCDCFFRRASKSSSPHFQPTWCDIFLPKQSVWLIHEVVSHQCTWFRMWVRTDSEMCQRKYYSPKQGLFCRFSTTYYGNTGAAEYN